MWISRILALNCIVNDLNVIENQLNKIALQPKVSNPFLAHEAEIIICYGSEKGSTKSFSIFVHNYLLKIGKKSFITELNDFQHFPSLNHLIVITATFGKGNAPFNAFDFFEKFKSNNIRKKFKYSVLGFGSSKFKTFCEYAEKVNYLLREHPKSTEALPLTKIDNKSIEDFSYWFSSFKRKITGQLHLPVYNSQLQISFSY